MSRELSDDECDPDLLAIGIRAPKLSLSKRRQNAYRPSKSVYIRPLEFGHETEEQRRVRREARNLNYEKLRQLGKRRG